MAGGIAWQLLSDHGVAGFLQRQGVWALLKLLEQLLVWRNLLRIDPVPNDSFIHCGELGLLSQVGCIIDRGLGLV